MGEGDEERICQHLNPKETFIENHGKKRWDEHEIPWHACRIKVIMELENTHCAFVLWTNDHGLEYVQYDAGHARSCPMYASNQREAARTRLAIISVYDSSR